MKFYKVTNEEEIHNGLQYHDGRVDDIVSFNETDSCSPGGIYFVREDILEYLTYNCWLREVIIPEDAKMVKDHSEYPEKWRASSVIFGPKEKITIDTVIRLLNEGVNFYNNPPVPGVRFNREMILRLGIYELDSISEQGID